MKPETGLALWGQYGGKGGVGNTQAEVRPGREGIFRRLGQKTAFRVIHRTQSKKRSCGIVASLELLLYLSLDKKAGLLDIT
jgi:hypothetical protein